MEVFDVNVINKNQKKWIQKNVFAPIHPARVLFTGTSGSGKTNCALCCIYKHLYFDKLYVYTRNPEQGCYATLREFMEKSTKELRKKLKDDNLEIYHEGHTLQDIIPLDDMNQDLQNLVVFDDFLTERDQSQINEFFSRGRHKNASVFYLSQSFYATPRLIRLNCNYFAFFGSPSKNDINMIARDIGLDMTKEEFISLWKEVLKEPYSFLFIDTVSTHLPLRYRMKFDNLYNPTPKSIDDCFVMKKPQGANQSK